MSDGGEGIEVLFLDIWRFEIPATPQCSGPRCIVPHYPHPRI